MKKYLLATSNFLISTIKIRNNIKYKDTKIIKNNARSDII